MLLNLVSYTYITVSSFDKESFLRYKYVLSNNRRSFKFDNLKKMSVVHSNANNFSKYLFLIKY